MPPCDIAANSKHKWQTLSLQNPEDPVISMRDKIVYIYNHTGILSKMQIDVYQNFGQVTRRGFREVSVTDQ